MVIFAYDFQRGKKFCFVLFSPQFACCLFQTSFPLCFCLICTQTRVCFLFWQITMRALGCELRKEEMRKIISQVDEEGSGKINFESFLQVMAQKMVCEPSWSQRLKFLLPNFTMQVLAVDWVTLAPCRGASGVSGELF